jgi:hypothetical protein
MRRAERIVRRGLAHCSLAEAEMGKQRKSDLKKVLIALVFREQTTVSLDWISG